ncbi:MAG: glutathione S-transferase family protein [Deltaproteobacteria bacterium]|nr:glutathione S-transferase family protein [Deltaproteobacteria bacterium]MBT4642186.1 glutathione S-transferase family protein [Deltaproteobacteria bacterium]MBT6499363.1 glutathione S-transferase family protein [Deltaproteobacteria bacterium]MBT7710263.1 glutathione S-transferase family protein [Deltaproteobacteria bacterium]
MSISIPANLLREQQEHEESQHLKPGQEKHYRIWQDRASPFSHKVMTYMNYKGIPYKCMQANLNASMETLPKLVGQTIVPVLITPDEEVLQDSTPIIEWFEERFSDKSVIPADPRLAFFMWVLEDFADEYMPRIHMHTRWGNEQNQQTASHRIARGLCYAMPDSSIKEVAAFIVGRQPGFDKHLGLNDNVRANMDEQILDLLRILEEHFQHHQFLLGFRPSVADFAMYGSLNMHLYNDPNSNTTMELNGPRTCEWLETIRDFGDTRGCVGQTEFGDWMDLDQGLLASLGKLLEFTAKTYVPFAKACALASKASEKQFEAEIFGINSTFSTHQYRVWTFEQVQKRYEALAGDDKSFVDKVLNETTVLPALMADDIHHSDLFDGFTPPVVKDGIADARIRHIKNKGKAASLL